MKKKSECKDNKDNRSFLSQKQLLSKFEWTPQNRAFTARGGVLDYVLFSVQERLKMYIMQRVGLLEQRSLPTGGLIS